MRIVVTGGTSGLGYGTACLAAERGWDVLLVGRDHLRGEQIASDLGARFFQADLSLMADVRRLADHIAEPVHALVMCAGGVSLSKETRLTGEGLEATFATNYLSKFTLSQLLLQRNKLASGGCILMVGGNGVHKKAPTDWASAHGGIQAALKAALAVDLYAAELARQTPNLRVHTCYPGMVHTKLFRHAPLPFRLLSWLLGKSIAEGSAHLGRLIFEEHTGVHWKENCPMRFAAPLPSSGPVGEALWSYSRQVVPQASFGVLGPM